MAMAMDPHVDEPQERLDDKGVDEDRRDTGEDETRTAAPAAETVGVAPAGDLPVEPTYDAEGEADAAADRARMLDELLAFHLYGHRESVEAAPSRSIPALLYAYRDLSRIRHDYPICLNGSDSAARPLAAIVDDLLATVAGDGDAGEQLKRSVYRLESHIKSLVGKEPGARLSNLWDRAEKQLLAVRRLSKKSKDLLQKDLSAARGALDIDGDLIPCNHQTAERMFQALVVSHWRRHCAAWRDELALLIQQLENMLGADFDRSEKARTPEYLRETLGRQADELDEDAMSVILRSSPKAETLPEKRRERVRKALSMMMCVKPVFDAGEHVSQDDEHVSFRVDTMVNDCEAALAEYEERARVMTEFFKSVRIARLEIANQYREPAHDKFFEAFGQTYLTPEEMALCPPVLVNLTPGSLKEPSARRLLELLGGVSPFKVLLQLDSLFEAGRSPQSNSIEVGWPTRLAGMAMALNHAYVLQAPVSNPRLLREGFLEGFDYAGPALFSVYVGPVNSDRYLSTYLRAAAAADSRSYPIIKFNPGTGSTLAEQIDVGDNAQGEEDWPMEAFRYRRANGDDGTTDVCITPADVLFCDDRFAEHFWAIPPGDWHENMVPLHEYIGMDEDTGTMQLPYIVTVDEKGVMSRVVITRQVLGAVLQCASFWRFLQESGGINNSFANKLLAEEKERLAEEKKSEIEAIEKNYVEQMDQDIGELTREIVQRIANQLMTDTGGGLGSLVMPVAATPAPTPAPTAEAAPAAPATEAVEEAVEEEEEEAPSFDDPYIDTPLCTTCNECTELNARVFAYNDNKQAYIKDAKAGPYSDLVRAAELCPVHIIHPGKPADPGEAGIDEWIKRAAKFN